jgi:hypothetical protein
LLRNSGKRKATLLIENKTKLKVGLNNNGNKEESTNSGRRRIHGVGDEADDEAGFPDACITDQTDLEGVIVAATHALT